MEASSILDFDQFPPPQYAEVWLDFDGTLTNSDVVDAVIREFSADGKWQQIEEAWQAGVIGSRACLAGRCRLQFRARRIFHTWPG